MRRPSENQHQRVTNALTQRQSVRIFISMQSSCMAQRQLPDQPQARLAVPAPVQRAQCHARRQQRQRSQRSVTKAALEAAVNGTGVDTAGVWLCPSPLSMAQASLLGSILNISHCTLLEYI